MALGLIRPDGRDPALKACMEDAPSIRAKASAIWLRLEFSTQTKRIDFVGDIMGLSDWHHKEMKFNNNRSLAAIAGAAASHEFSVEG